MAFDLASLGWDAAWTAAYAPLHAPGRSPARVLRVDRGIATLLGAAGTARASLAGAQLARAGRDAAALPAAGDWAVVRAWPDRRITVEALLPRRTQVTDAQLAEAQLAEAPPAGLLAEPVPAARARVIAANMDVLAVVEPIDTAPDLERIERLLSLAWDCGARPIVLLTKADLARGPEVIAARVARTTPALEVIALSSRTGRNLARLRPLVTGGQTLGLIGRADGGTATLIDALAGLPVLVREEIRLITMPSGGSILDIPDIAPLVPMIGKKRTIGVVDRSAYP